MKKTPTDRELTRRDALKLCGAFGLGVSLGGSILWHGLEALAEELPKGNFIVGSDGGKDNSASDTVVVVNMAAGEVWRIPVKAKPHQLLFNPYALDQVFYFEKYGTRAGKVDLQQRKEVWTHTIEFGDVLSGHALFIPGFDSPQLVITGKNAVTEEGFISFRNSSSFASQRRLSSYGIFPHEFKYVANNGYFIVANRGNDEKVSSLAWVDLKMGNLLQKLPVPGNAYRVSHFAINAEGMVIAIADNPPKLINRPGGIFFSHGGGPLQPAEIPTAAAGLLRGQVLSVALDRESRIACTTNPIGRFLGFWNMDDGKCVSYLDIDGTLGVVLSRDGSHFIVSTQDRKLLFIDAKTFTVNDDLSRRFKLGDGSHLYLSPA